MNIHELEKLATPGPWIAVSGSRLPNWLMPDREMFGMPSSPETLANARLSAHCRNNFMKALEALKEARESIWWLDDSMDEREIATDRLEELIKELEEVK